jgi:hypothetical protein
MPSPCVSRNIYAALAEPVNIEDDGSDSNEDVENTDDEDDMDIEQKIHHTLFDLVELEEQHAHRPIFTRKLLQQLASEIEFIKSEQSKSASEHRPTFLQYQEEDGQEVKTWVSIRNANSVAVNYMTRVELHPEFQSRFGNDFDRNMKLKKLNNNTIVQTKSNLAVPYFIESYRRAPNTLHMLDTTIQWRNRLHHTQALWEESASCKQLCDIILDGARKTTPITKIICLGLGKLDLRPEWYGSVLQHLTVFSIADKLNTSNTSRDVNCLPVQIIAQDPCYEQNDRNLLQELTSYPIKLSLTDPETLLAIDSNTLVVTAFLPTKVPLMQIIADLFAGLPGQGPAMMLCDRIDVDTQKRSYCLRNREAPHVARFVEEGYTEWKGEFVGLEGELAKDAGWEGKEHAYWLRKMGLYLRRSVASV